MIINCIIFHHTFTTLVTCIKIIATANKKHIIVKVWERGAGLTKACGTAACATAVSGAFLKLNENATVSLYTLDGERVRTKLESTTGRASWDGRNDAGAEVISGLYIYHIEGEGVQKIGQIMIIR